MIPGLARLAAAIKAEGAVACLQISHAGSSTSSAVLGRTPVGPSAVRHPCERDGEVPDPLTPGGIALDEACLTAARFADAGVDLISVSGGLQGSELTGRTPGYFVPYAAAIKSFVAIPIIVTGGISDVALADRIVRNGQADMVGIGRAMLNDAEWARKAIRLLQASSSTPPSR